MRRGVAQSQNLQGGAHFRHFPDLADVEGGDPHTASRLRDGKALRFQPPEGFAHRHMAGVELRGDMVLTQFRAGFDLARDDAVCEDAADAGCDGFAGRVLDGLNHGFIDNLLCLTGRAILLLLTGNRWKRRFCWTNGPQFLITPPFCTESTVAGPAALLCLISVSCVALFRAQHFKQNRGAMAGHSQFKNIMHRKGRQDAVRSKMFSKLGREITVAAKQGLPDPTMNPRLRLAIQNAKAQSMPKDNIERAIKKAAGNDGENYDEVRYEGRGPGGVSVIVEALTDNRNRTASNVRAAFTKSGGSLGETGSVSFMFDRVGEIIYKPEVGDADKVMEAAIEAGADDVQSGEEEHVIICAFEDIGEVSKALEAALGEAESIKTIWKPQTNTELDEEKPVRFSSFQCARRR